MKRAWMWFAVMFMAFGWMSVAFAQETSVVSAVEGKTDAEITVYLANLNEDGWVALFNALDADGYETLQIRVLVLAQNVLHTFDEEKSARYVEKIKSDCPSVVVRVNSKGDWILLLVEGADPLMDDRVELFSTDTFSKGASIAR